MLSNLLTASRLRSFRACARQHHLRYELGYVPAQDAPALRFGTLVHTALEAWWLAQAAPGRDPFDDALRALPDAGALDPFEAARLTAMLAGYDAAWGEWARGVQVLGVELQFDHPLVNPATGYPSLTWRMGGKIDALVRLPDGRVAVVEHKTSSDKAEPGSAYRARLAMDGQVSAYIEGAQALGYPADLVVYDVLVKPALRPLLSTPPEARRFTKAGTLYASQRAQDEDPAEYRERLLAALGEAPEQHYLHVEVVRLEGEREEHRYDTWQLGKMIREGELSGFAPRNPDACHRYGSPCPYWPVCTGIASLDDPAAFRRVENVHPELQPAEPQAA